MRTRSLELWAGKGLCIAVLLVLIAMPASCFPITNYVTKMDIQPDSSINVTETIVADFTGDPHHGIYRDIPLTTRDKWGMDHRLRVQDVEVTDGSGSPLQTATSRANGRIHLRIGNPDVMLSDVRTYIIHYKLWRAVNFSSQWDELYWNPVGPEWEVPIEAASCIVTLPKDAPKGSIRTQSYTGSYGQTTSEAKSDIPDRRTARFWMTRALNPGEAMTVVVGWPKGIVGRPSSSQELLWFLTDNGFFFVVPLFLIGLVVLWTRVGADPDTGRSEMVAYDPPDNLNPAELGTLIDEHVDMRDISASIIDLAVRGFITIKESQTPGFLRSSTDYTLSLTRPYMEVTTDSSLTPFEVSLIHGLFGGKEFCVVSALKHNFYTHIPSLQRSLYDSMRKHGYFTHSPESTRQSCRGAGIAILIGGVFLAFFSAGSAQLAVGWGVSIAICGLILAIAARTMPRKTSKGKNALLAARGFEEYLSRAERQMIEHQERQGYFERFLPYAMAFGIADKWAKAFEGIQTVPPDWYSGREGPFHPVVFADHMSYMASDWGSTMASQPRSSGGSGGSGFSSGGGFSGGGGGGGGGGGW